MKSTVNLIAAHSEGFILFQIFSSTSGDWINVKLNKAHGPKVGKKKNWWFGWNTKELRVSHTGDVKSLQKHRPDVLAWVEHELRNTSFNTGTIRVVPKSQ